MIPQYLIFPSSFFYTWNLKPLYIKMFVAHIFLFKKIMIIEGTTCRSKCDVRMNNIESRMINSLGGVVLTIGGNSYKSDACMGSRNNGRYLIFNCSSLQDGNYTKWYVKHSFIIEAVSFKFKFIGIMIFHKSYPVFI